MTRPLLLTAVCGYIAAIVCFAAAASFGGLNLSFWSGDWPMGYLFAFHGPSVSGEGPTVTRELAWGGGEELHVVVPVDVSYTQGPAVRVTATGPKGTVDQLILDDEMLRFDRRVRRPGRVQVVITAPDVREFMLAGSPRLTITGFDHDSLSVQVAGSGTVVAAGKARSVEAHVGGSGDVDLGGVESDQAEVHIGGSGEAVVSPKLRAEVHIGGSGKVTLTTDPANLETHIGGSGQIVRRPATPVPVPAAPAKTAS